MIGGSLHPARAQAGRAGYSQPWPLLLQGVVLPALAVYVACVAFIWTLAAYAHPHQSLLARWVKLDAGWFAIVARQGYPPTPRLSHHLGYAMAFFPGLPVLERIGHAITGLAYTTVGMSLSLIGGAIAAIFLGLLSAMDMPDRPTSLTIRSVALFFIFPAAYLATTGYSEAVFLGFAVPAWWAARRNLWWLSGLLAAGAAAVRIEGVFLLAGLVVLFLCRPRSPDESRWSWRGLWLLLGVVPPLLFVAYLHHLTGLWTAYSDVQRLGWGRHWVTPFTWFTNAWATKVPVAYHLDSIYAGLMGLFAVALLVTRRWAEATYVGLCFIADVVSNYHYTSARTLFVCFPVFLLLGRLTVRLDQRLPVGLLLWLATLGAAAYELQNNVVSFVTLK
jgi:hypothetical protein